MSVSLAVMLNAGTYSYRVELTDKDNTEWDDTAGGSLGYDITVTVNKKKIDKQVINSISIDVHFIAVVITQSKRLLAAVIRLDGVSAAAGDFQLRHFVFNIEDVFFFRCRSV